METTKPQKRIKQRLMVDVFIMGALLITAGILIMLRNLGYLDTAVFRAVISWPSLLLVLGVWSMIHRHLTFGILLMSVGGFFLIPYITNADAGWMHTYWPFALVIAGILIFISHLLPSRWKHHRHNFPINTKYDTTDGFVTAENDFGSLHQIVLDDVFKGARIKNNFGGTVLDLRGTTIEPGDTIIELESSFGGVEIYVPTNWVVIVELDSSLAGVDDKRKFMTNSQPQLRLIIRGKISFSGVEIRN